MGDLRAGTDGTIAAQPTGKRAARHRAEQVSDTPYVGRRIAAAPGRRRVEPALGPVVAQVTPPPPPPVFSEAMVFPSLPVHRVVPVVIAAPVVAAPVVTAAPAVLEPVLAAPLVVEPEVPELVVPELVVPELVVPEPVVPEPVEVESPTIPLPPVTHLPHGSARVAPRRAGSHGRRAARRRSSLPLPGAPLLVGVAVLAVSAGGALQAMRPDAQAADTSHLAAATALAHGSSGQGAGAATDSTALLGHRAPVISRDEDRLQATADAQAKQRAAALSGIASKTQAQSRQIQLHAWVLPVQVGVYHLTARFGEYSSLWANFHTGLDFAAPTGTPIMAVAGGVITETAYSGAYGNRTIERLPDGTELWYCHQNEFGTKVGATVKPGEDIGYVGSTGNVTGPHLHLEVHPHGGDAVDPYPVLVAHGLYPGPPA
jgi:murein DD-endopeptidase MepM/ murein hydrolase activator NlpD